MRKRMVGTFRGSGPLRSCIMAAAGFNGGRIGMRVPISSLPIASLPMASLRCPPSSNSRVFASPKGRMSSISLGDDGGIPGISQIMSASESACVAASLQAKLQAVLDGEQNPPKELLAQAVDALGMQQKVLHQVVGQLVGIEVFKRDRSIEIKDKDIEIKDKDIEIKDKDIEIATLIKDKDIEIKDKDIEIATLKGNKDKEIVELKAALDSTTKDLLRSSGKLTSRGIYEHTLGLIHAHMARNRENIISAGFATEAKTLVSKKFVAASVCECIGLFAGKVVGFPGPHEKMLVDAFASMQKAYPQSKWSTATPADFFQALYGTVSADIHGAPWSELKVRSSAFCMLSR